MNFFLNLIFTALIIFSNHAFAEPKVKDLVSVKIGWQIPWAIQGQLVQILKHTDILKKNGIKAEFIGKTAGPELNELALGAQVDVILTADQPAAALFMKNTDWLAISRLMYNRTSTYVPLKSKINSLNELTNKTVGVPFGTAAQRIVVEAIEQNKVADVKFINLGMLEHAPLIERSGAEAEKFGDFDALSGFDPIPAILEANNKVRTLHKGKVCALVVTNKSFLAKNKNIGKLIVKSFKEAYSFYQKNTEQANAWFTEEAKLTASSKVFEIAAEYEVNLKPKAKIYTDFKSEDFELIQKAADFVSKTTNKKINIKDFVTNEFQ